MGSSPLNIVHRLFFNDTEQLGGKKMKPVKSFSDFIDVSGYGIASVALSAGIGAVLVGCGKTAALCGRFFKKYGSTIGTGLIGGVTVFVSVPLSKKSLQLWRPSIEWDPKTKGILDSEQLEKMILDKHRARLVGLMAFLATTLFANRVTSSISGYSLSLMKRLGLGLTSGSLAYVTNLYFQKKLFQGKKPYSKKTFPLKHLNNEGDLHKLHDVNTLDVLVKRLKGKGYRVTEKHIAEFFSHYPKNASTCLWKLHRAKCWEVDGVLLSPFVIIAHLQKNTLEENFLFDENQDFLKYKNNGYEDAFSSALGDNGLRGRYDAKTIALLISTCKAQQRKEYLKLIEKGEYKDYHDRLITRGDVEAHLPPLLDHIVFPSQISELENFEYTTAQGVARAMEKNSLEQLKESLANPGGFDPLLLLAYFPNIEVRNQYLRECKDEELLKKPVADAKVLAMLSEQASLEDRTKALEALALQKIRDRSDRLITREWVLEEMNFPPPPRIEVISGKDWIVAGLSGVGAVVASTVVVSILIFAQYAIAWGWTRKSATLTPFKWGLTQLQQGWKNHPTLRGVAATAITSGMGYSGGKVITGSNGVAQLAALIFAILAAPSFAKHYFNCEMGKSVALTSVLAGIVLRSKIPYLYLLLSLSRK